MQLETSNKNMKNIYK